MYSLDVSAMLRLDCKNVSFNVANRQVTIAIGCLHVVHRDDPHAVCTAAQFAAFGKLCCTTKGTMCPKGRRNLENDDKAYEAWVKPRAAWLARMRDKGGEVTVECMGPADVTNSLRLRAYYLVKYGIEGVRKYQERLEEVLVARVPKTEQGEHSEKIMKIRKEQVAKRARADRRLNMPEFMKASKKMP